MPDGLDAHEPIASVAAGMKVAVIDQRFHGETKGAVPAEQRILDVGGVLALLHPDALFEQRVGKRKPPHRNAAFQAETLDVEITLGFDGAAQPTICSEREL